MTKSSAQLLRAFLFAIVIAGGFATVGLIAQSVCGNPLACFEPGQEGEIWQGLTPFGETNDAACTNSLHPDPARVRNVARQCVRTDEQQPVPQPYPVLMPPSLGQFLDPFALAVDGERIYISDQSNHRVQVFKFDGTPVQIAYPIGDGVPGSGPYGPYPADSRMTGNSDPMTGQRLYSPDGLAVDAAGKLIVGDYSGYINVFNPDGSPAFGTFANPQRLQVIDSVGDNASNFPDVASGIAMTPGTVVHGIGVAPPPGDNHRIFVTNRNNCFVQIYDSGFNLLRQIPEVVPTPDEQGSCKWDEEPGATLGVFSSPVAAAIDAQGHVYVSDYDNNRIQILDLLGNPVGEFGREELQYPWGVVVDHKGRVAVADTENQRIAVFTVDYSGPAPVASFVFELDAKGTLDGTPTAIAAQQGTGTGLDPAGRFLATDTLNNRIQRFQLPDLAIINKAIDPGGFGSFQVVVPDGKAAPVEYVGVSAVGVGATVISINGVAPGNPAPLNPLNSALDNATVALGTTIAPGQVVTYNFTFTPDPGQSEYNFLLNAVGNGGATAADEEDVEASQPCLDCVSTHTVYVAPGAPSVLATMSNGWYNTPLTVRINATTTHVDGLSGIAYQFLSGPEASGQRWGGSIHLMPVSGNAAFIDFGVQSQGVSSLRYWAIGADGTVEASHPLTLSLDLSAPDVVFAFPAANLAGWNNDPAGVIGTWSVNDGPSGPAVPTAGSLSFPDEGRQQFQTVDASDLAGNVATDVPSNQAHNNGRDINIDWTAPTLTPPANLNITIPATAAGYAIAPGTFVATATDPDLADPRTGTDKSGSGVAVLLNPEATQFPVGETTPFVFTATDAAGNTSTANASVTVTKATSTLGAENVEVQYGQPTVVSAQLGATFATGTVTFTFGPNGEYSVGGVINGGFATASVPPVLLAVGNYPMQVTYPGDTSVLSVATSATVTVVPAPITVTAQPGTKVYGETDPGSFAYSITSGALVGSDAFSGSTARVAGENVNSYAIQQGSLALSTNYALVYVGANFTITTRPVTVTADAKSKPITSSDPLLTYQVTAGSVIAGDAFQGELARDTGEAAGTYAIRQGTLSLGSNYALTFVGANLQITQVLVTVYADFLTKEYGQDDPVLTFSFEPSLPPGIAFSGGLSRDPGENRASYVIRQGSLSLPDGFPLIYNGNTFSITPRPATITAGDAGKMFGTPDPPLTVTASGFLPDDEDDIALSVTRVAGEDAGTYSTLPDATGQVLNNYTLGEESGTFTIAKAPAIVRAAAAGITYGDTTPVFGFTYAPLPGGMVAADIDTVPTCSVAGAHTDAGAYTITCANADDRNLTFSYEPAPYTVAPKTVQLVINDKNRAFGVANPDLDAVATGVEPGDTLAYTLSTTATLASPVGGYPITAQFAPGSNPNYIVQVTDGTLNIGVASVTLTINNQSKTYGDDNPALDAVVTGLPVGGTLNYTLETAATPASGAGGYPITAVLGANPNFIVSVVDAELTVNPRPIAVTADAGSKTYGTADPALTYGFTGGPLVGGDAFGGELTRVAGSDVGGYAIGQGSLALNANYTLTFTGANFTIDPAPAMVTAGGGSKVYGDADPVIGVSATGFLAEDNITLSASRAAGENVFSGYVTTPDADGAKLGNYNVDYVTGLFSITKRPATVTAGGGSKVYGDSDPVITATSSDFLPADNIVLTGSREAGDNVGAYDTFGVATGEAASNYEITQVNGTFTISKAPATVTANDKSKFYGETNPGLDATVTGVLGTDSLSYSLAAPTATQTSGVGNYPINVTLGDNPNYEVTPRDGILTVVAKPITVTANPQTKVYGDADPSLTYALNGALVGGDVVSGTLTRAAGTNVGSYDITQGDLTLGANYDVSFVGASLEITRKPASITALNNSKVEGTSDPALLTTSTGFLPADTIVVTATRASGETPGPYVITPQASGAALGNYTVTTNTGVFTIVSANHAPVALDDSAVANGTAPVTIAVLANDSDADGDTLTVTAVTQPAGGVGTVTIVGNTVVFTASSTFAGSATFTYTISDGHGGTATATVTVSSCDLTGYRTQSQGGWGTNPSGSNPGAFLAANFATVFPNGVQVGGTYTLRFTSAAAVAAYLPRGGTPGMLTSSGVNTRWSHGAGNFGGQVLALQISVAFSNAGVTRSGLSSLVLTSGPLAGSTVGQVLTIANAVLGGNAAALPHGMSIRSLNTVVDKLNNNFVGGTQNNGYLAGAGCGVDADDDEEDDSAPPTVTANNQSNTAGASVSVQITAADPDDDTLSFSATGLPPGTSISSGGLITGTLSAAGTYNVTITVIDEEGLSSSATFVWTVTAASANRPPNAVNDSVSAVKNTAKVISVLANDTDPDGNTLTIQSVTQPSKGTVVKNSNGTVTFTPKKNHTGTVTFNYTVSDGHGGTDTAKVTVTIKSSHWSGDGCHDH